MNTLAWRLCALVTLTLLGACQRQNVVELTRVARGVYLETQIAAVRETATVDSERLQVTLEYMATRVEVIRRQYQGMSSTLVARGSPAPGRADLATATPFPQPDDALSAARVAPAAGRTAPAPGQVVFGDVVMAASVRADDCADERRVDFQTDSERIYIVATAYNLRAGARLAARFVIAGREILHEWRPAARIDGNCIWFFIDQSDLPFVTGTWSARLELDGQPASETLSFDIRDAAG